MSVIDWWNDGSKTSEWAIRILPALARQARSQRPITYGALAAEIGMPHHRPVQRAAGHIGYALGEISTLRGWRKRQPPALQSLIVNKATGLPGHGVDWFMDGRYRLAKTKAQREAALLTVHGQIYSYPYWSDVLRLLDVDPDSINYDSVSFAAANWAGRGGEGPEHKALKEFVSVNPSILGLPDRHPAGQMEYPLPSGDQVDVVFSSGAAMTAVEVKSRISGSDDIARGIFQCVKYRAVLEAWSWVSTDPVDVSVALVLGGDLPGELLGLANSFAIPVIPGIVPS